MENTLFKLPEIGNWERVYHIDSEKDYMKHDFSELTEAQINIIEKFVKEHNNYYICSKGRNKLTLCQGII